MQKNSRWYSHRDIDSHLNTYCLYLSLHVVCDKRAQFLSLSISMGTVNWVGAILYTDSTLNVVLWQMHCSPSTSPLSCTGSLQMQQPLDIIFSRAIWWNRASRMERLTASRWSLRSFNREDVLHSYQEPRLSIASASVANLDSTSEGRGRPRTMYSQQNYIVLYPTQFTALPIKLNTVWGKWGTLSHVTNREK